MRGPCTSPVRTASASDQSAPPASRTVVKPRSSMPFMMGSERIMVNTLGILATAPRLNEDATTCTWQSIRPGIRVMPLASSVVVPSGTDRSVPTAAMRPSCTRTDRPVRSVSAWTSSTRLFSINKEVMRFVKVGALASKLLIACFFRSPCRPSSIHLVHCSIYRVWRLTRCCHRTHLSGQLTLSATPKISPSHESYSYHLGHIYAPPVPHHL